jgi:hypothetical protein
MSVLMPRMIEMPSTRLLAVSPVDCATRLALALVSATLATSPLAGRHAAFQRGEEIVAAAIAALMHRLAQRHDGMRVVNEALHQLHDLAAIAFEIVDHAFGLGGREAVDHAVQRFVHLRAQRRAFGGRPEFVEEFEA